MSFSEILSLIEFIAIALAVIVLTIYYLIKAIKNKWLTKITQTINNAIAEAKKKFTESGQGEEKKKYVLEKVANTCNELGIPFNLIYKLINKLIDKTIECYNIISKSENKKDEN